MVSPATLQYGKPVFIAWRTQAEGNQKIPRGRRGQKEGPPGGPDTETDKVEKAAVACRKELDLSGTEPRACRSTGEGESMGSSWSQAGSRQGSRGGLRGEGNRRG